MINRLNCSSSSHRSVHKLVLDVPEPVKRDNSLDGLMLVRKQRLRRLERECYSCRQEWRSQRQNLRERKKQWRAAQLDAEQYWQQARAEFFRMSLTSGEFKKAKSVYGKMKTAAALLRVEAKTQAEQCKTAGHDFFLKRQELAEAQKKNEKLQILRDEMRREEHRSE